MSDRAKIHKNLVRKLKKLDKERKTYFFKKITNFNKPFPRLRAFLRGDLALEQEGVMVMVDHPYFFYYKEIDGNFYFFHIVEKKKTVKVKMESI